MQLHDLKPTKGAKKERKRVGRGIAAGQGKTAGRGVKGQGARAGGGTRLYHQGGNLPFFRRLPFMRGKGFTPINRVNYHEVNVGQLKEFKTGSEVNPETLVAAGLVHDHRKPVVLLGDGEVKVALNVSIHRITKGARSKIESAGGSVEIISKQDGE
ncbi:MAG TPA: 50S ribosomal protein L15 [Anaerolineales bacterium]|jgi:large subunit ribosomal protein L15|nr:50S ribosomal protein L15 [Anaerolineales bacterium]HUV28981.1 50S ribosomal protein L15 [Anaerolineales bacterium]HUV92772.1 50S ribosomal protein L15 [Anaerolineales bacterium]